MVKRAPRLFSKNNFFDDLFFDRRFSDKTGVCCVYWVLLGLLGGCRPLHPFFGVGGSEIMYFLFMLEIINFLFSYWKFVNRKGCRLKFDYPKMVIISKKSRCRQKWPQNNHFTFFQDKVQFSETFCIMINNVLKVRSIMFSAKKVLIEKSAESLASSVDFSRSKRYKQPLSFA